MIKKKTFLSLAFVLFLVLFVGSTYMNAYLADTFRTKLERRVFEQTGLELDAGVATGSFLSGDMAAHGVTLSRPDSPDSFVSAQQLTFDANPRSFLRNVVQVNFLDVRELQAMIDLSKPDHLLIASAEAQPAPSEDKPGFRIDRVTVDADWIVVRHAVPSGGTVDWRIQPMAVRTQDIRLPAPPDVPVEATLSAQLLEPSTGRATARLVATRRATQWDLSCKEKAVIEQVAALNPYLTADFPLVASSGSLTLESDTNLTGSNLESTINVALLQPRFQPRERNLKAMFTGPLATTAIQVIKDATGDIVLDPITVRGDLNDPKFDPQGQVLTNVRNQLLRKILRQGKNLPVDIVRQMESRISSLPKIGTPLGGLLKGAGGLTEKAIETGSGLAEKTKDIGDAAKKMTEELQNLQKLLPLGGKKKKEKE